MPVGNITAARYPSAAFVERSKGTHPVRHAVEAIHIGGNLGAVGIEPRAGSDPVPGVYGVGTLCAEITAPRAVAYVGAFRQVLADGIGPFETSQIAAVAGTCAGHEKGHRPRRRLGQSESCGEQAAKG